MTDQPTGAVDNCPACGADMRGAASPACPLCGWAPVAAEDHPPEIVFLDEPETNPYAAPRAEVGRGRTFSIGSMMLLIGLIAVVLGLAVTNPALGVLLGVVSVPALLRVHVAIGDRDEPPDAVERLTLFARSFFVSAVTFLSAAIAFTATCFPVGYVGFMVGYGSALAAIGLLLAVAVGLFSAGFVVWFLARKIWPLKDRRG